MKQSQGTDQLLGAKCGSCDHTEKIKMLVLNLSHGSHFIVFVSINVIYYWYRMWQGAEGLGGLWTPDSSKALFLKPFTRRCHQMVIGQQSAPVMALIWIEGRLVAWRTVIRILRLSTGEKKTNKQKPKWQNVLLCLTSAAMAHCERPCSCSSMILPRSKTLTFIAFVIRRS